MRSVDRAKILEIVSRHAGITPAEVTAEAYPEFIPGSADFRTAKIRVFQQLQDLKKHGQIIRAGIVPGTKDTGIWRAVA